MEVGVRGRGPARVMTIERAVELLSGSRSAVALTGAGVSAESGIPTFRGEGGLWSQYDPVKVASIDSFMRSPGAYWEVSKHPGPPVLAPPPHPAPLSRPLPRSPPPPPHP